MTTQKHRADEPLIKYMTLLTHATKKEGDNPMVCEGILNLCGTSSKKIEERTIERTKAIYVPQIQQLTNENINLNNEISRLKELLKIHKIVF